jgi:DNA polymerase-3 subunit gamma/tau
VEEGERERAGPLAAALGMPVLTRAWQMLLKGIEEVQLAPAPAQAAEMVLIRLAYVADLPVPADLVRQLTTGETVPPSMPAPPRTAGVSPATGGRGASPPAPTRLVDSGASSPLALAPQPQPEAAPTAQYDAMPQSFGEVIALFDQRREALIRSQLWSHVHLVAFEPGRIEFRPHEAAPRDLANRLGQLLGDWTGTRWVVAVSQAEGAPTLAETAERHDSALRNEVAAHPLVRAVLDTFPGATIAAVRERFAAAEPAAEATADEPVAGEDMASDPGEDASTEEDGS